MAADETTGDNVAERTYALTEVVGTSKIGVDEAIRNAVTRLSKTVDHLDWFEVIQMRGYIREGAVDHFQVTLKVGSRLEDA
jgi:flavin-binding protein dodecin